jgi:hypothetical protein
MSEPNKTKDDTGLAPESGEPKESGRSRGQVVAGESQLEDREKAKGDESKEAWASGRQDGAVRSGE